MTTNHFLLRSIILSLLCLPSIVQGQYWEWARSLGDITGNTVIQTITSDSNQNLFAAGYFSCKTLVTGETTLTNKGQNDILVI